MRRRARGPSSRLSCRTRRSQARVVRVGRSSSVRKERNITHGAEEFPGASEGAARTHGGADTRKRMKGKREEWPQQQCDSQVSSAPKRATARRSLSERHSHDIDASSSATAWPGRNNAARALESAALACKVRHRQCRNGARSHNKRKRQTRNLFSATWVARGTTRSGWSQLNEVTRP